MKEKREEFRVDAKILIGSLLLRGDEVNYAQSRLAGPTKRNFHIPQDHPDPRLNAWLKTLNAKLDLLLELQSGKTEGGPKLKNRPVNISVGGIMFPSDTDYEVGDKIEIHMELPMKKPISLVIVAKVLRVNPPLVSTVFINMQEDIKQKLADFIFFREREILMSERM